MHVVPGKRPSVGRVATRRRRSEPARPHPRLADQLRQPVRQLAELVLRPARAGRVHARGRGRRRAVGPVLVLRRGRHRPRTATRAAATCARSSAQIELVEAIRRKHEQRRRWSRTTRASSPPRARRPARARALRRGRLPPRRRRRARRSRAVASAWPRRGVAYITLAHLIWRGVADRRARAPVPQRRGSTARWFPQPDDGADGPRARRGARDGRARRARRRRAHERARARATTFALLDELDPGPVGAGDRQPRRLPLRHPGVHARPPDAITRIKERDGVVGLIFATAPARRRAVRAQRSCHRAAASRRRSTCSAATSTRSARSPARTATRRSAPTSTASSSRRCRAIKDMRDMDSASRPRCASATATRTAT